MERAGVRSQNKDLLHIKNRNSFNKYRRWQPQRERPDIAAQRGFQTGTPLWMGLLQVLERCQYLLKQMMQKNQRTMPMTSAKERRTTKATRICFCRRLMVAMTGAPHLGQVRAWSLTCPLHSWHWMSGISYFIRCGRFPADRKRRAGVWPSRTGMG